MEANDKSTHILEKAEDLFADKGFEAATVRDIADAAGVNLAMISYYFGSKEKMMEALFRRRMESLKVKLELLLKDTALSPFEKIESLIRDYVRKVVETQSFYKILMCEQVMKKNPVIGRLIRELKMGNITLFAELVKEGQRKKVFKKNVDVVMAMTTMTGTVNQMLVSREFYAEYYGLRAMKKEEVKVMLSEKLNAHLVNLFKTILGYEE